MNVESNTEELRRVAAVEKTGLLDTGFESVYDDITELAAEICQTPAAYIALVDSARQWFKSVRGLPCRETSSSGSICAYTVRQNRPLVVPDTKKDARFHNSPVVRGFGIRFYAGVPIRNRDGLALGSLCVVDFVPRVLSEAQHRALRTLAQQVETQIALREQVAMLEAAEQQQKELAAALAASEAQFRAFMDHSPAAAFIKNAEGRMLYCNRSFADLFSAHPGHFTGKLDTELWTADQAAGFRTADLSVLTEERAVELEERVDLPGAPAIVLKTHKFPIRNSAGELLLAGIALNITEQREQAEELRAANAELERLALIDPLTTVGNRRALDLALQRNSEIARVGHISFGMLMVDVDHFKQLNDTFGHSFGDIVLRRIGELLRCVVRRVDQVCRFGGEEFAILLPEADLIHSRSIGERIRREVEALDFAPARVTVSVGIAVWQAALSGPADLIRLADSALYTAKAQGRNQVAVASAA